MFEYNGYDLIMSAVPNEFGKQQTLGGVQYDEDDEDFNEQSSSESE